MQAQTHTNSKPEPQGHRAVGPQSDIPQCGAGALAGLGLPVGVGPEQPSPRSLGVPKLCGFAGVGGSGWNPGWLPLCSFSLHIRGRHFLLPGACGSGFHPDGKSHPGALKGELTMETPWGAHQTQGQVATGRPSPGQAQSPANREGRGRGVQLDFPSQAHNSVHT